MSHQGHQPLMAMSHSDTIVSSSSEVAEDLKFSQDRKAITDPKECGLYQESTSSIEKSER